MLKMGEIEPAKVERSALQNAASIASLLLTTDAIVSDLKEEKESAGAGAGGGGCTNAGVPMENRGPGSCKTSGPFSF